MGKRIYLIFFFVISITHAQDLSGYGSFLLISPSAKSAALGNTMHSVIGNPAALFSNPANLGLTDAGSAYVNGSVKNHYFGQYISAGMLLPLGQINVGLAISNLKIGNIEAYNSEAIYEGSFNSNDIGLILGLAYYHRKMSWGLSVKYLKSSFSLSNTDGSQAFGFDLGFTSENLRIGPVPLTVGFTASRYISFREGELLKEFVPSSAVLGFKSEKGINNILFTPFLDVSLQKTRPTTLNWGLSIDYRLPKKVQSISNLSIFFGKKGYYLEDGAQIGKTELNQISKGFNFGMGFSFAIQKLMLDLNYCQNLNNIYIKRDFISIAINWK